MGFCGMITREQAKQHDLHQSSPARCPAAAFGAAAGRGTALAARADGDRPPGHRSHKKRKNHPPAGTAAIASADTSRCIAWLGFSCLIAASKCLLLKRFTMLEPDFATENSARNLRALYDERQARSSPVSEDL
jgi:hypothetical protein